MSALLTVLVGGCFQERAVPMRPGDRLSACERVVDAAPDADVRGWLASAHRRLEHRLPRARAAPLLTDELSDARGRPIDIFAHFGRDPRRLHTLIGNLSGLAHTAQAAGAGMAVTEPAPPWPGCEDVWVPIRDGLALSARWGQACAAAGEARDAIVLLPGLLGDNAVLRTRELARALRQAGLHVLALELRGHGQTEARHPDVAYTFGTLEVGDLMAVSEWLQVRPEVARTGLIGFCWSANLALLAAWEDGRADNDPLVATRLRPHLRPRSGQAHYEAGVIAFSPVLRFESIVASLERECSMLSDPVLDNLQGTVAARMRSKRHDGPPGSLRRLIEGELGRSDAPYNGSVEDGLQYLRLLPFAGKPAGNKLAAARVPVLIVHGANDPLSPAQDVADLMATVSNRRVAAVILPGGGHVGFGPYARSYYYGLILSYFAPGFGAAGGR